MPITLDGTGSISGLSATGISTVQNVPATSVITTLNAPSGVLATQNGMTGIAKAWVYYKGTPTVGIQGSFNVSSVTYNGVGIYTINMTSALANSNYAVVTGISGNGAGGSIAVLDDPSTTTQFTVRSRANTGGSVVDDFLHCAVFSS